MLLAHLAPGYFAAAHARPGWEPDWGRAKRSLLWTVALGSTIAPDLDVIYSVLFRGVFHHTTLWTHSVFVYIPVGVIWWALARMGRHPYLRALIGLIAVGGASHLLLDVASHGTPLLYPFTLTMFGWPPARVLAGGLRAYVTDPIFLAEPALLALAAAHWVVASQPAPWVRRLVLWGLGCGLGAFTAAFLVALPRLQQWAGI